MVSYSLLISAILPIFLLIGIGYILRQFKWVSDEGESSLMHLLVKVFYPCLIFKFILGNEALQDISNITQAPIAGLGFTALGIAIAYFAAPIFRVSGASERRTFAVSAGIFNYGYVAIPVASQVFDSSMIGVLVVFNFGVEFAIWTLAIILLSGKFRGKDWLKILNPPLIAMVLAVIINFTVSPNGIPSFLLQLIDMLGSCAIPIGLMLIGATMQDLLTKMPLHKDMGTALGAICLRLGLIPCVMLLLAKLLPISNELKQVIAVQAAMPAAVFPIVLAKYYGGTPAISLTVVLITLLLGILSIPLWLQAGVYLLGLG